MTWNADAGRTLLVKDDAAEQVGVKLDRLVAQLQAIQEKFNSGNADLGMKGAPEGDGQGGWNGYVDQANAAIVKKLDGFIKTAQEMATRAHNFQKQCHQIDDSVANQYKGLERNAGYPQ